MALIKCPECGRSVSDRAAVCPDCGYPIAQASSTGGDVAIKVGRLIGGSGFTGSIMRASVRMSVYGPNGELLAEGKEGTVVRFHIDEPLAIFIEASGYLKPIYEGMVYPKTRYELVMIPSFFINKFTLNEVDVIDSGW